MRRPFKAALAPDVIVAVAAKAAACRAPDSGPGRRLDELSQERPAAATHFSIEGANSAVREAALMASGIKGSRARQAELFFQSAATNEALETHQARTKAPAHSGRGGGGRGRCDPGSIVQPDSEGDPMAVNPSSGASGKYHFLPGTWAGAGGCFRAQDAPGSVQDERFNQMWAGAAGSSHWGC